MAGRRPKVSNTVTGMTVLGLPGDKDKVLSTAQRWDASGRPRTGYGVVGKALYALTEIIQADGRATRVAPVNYLRVFIKLSEVTPTTVRAAMQSCGMGCSHAYVVEITRILHKWVEYFDKRVGVSRTETTAAKKAAQLSRDPSSYEWNWEMAEKDMLRNPDIHKTGERSQTFTWRGRQ